ncbi:hypothetical protein IQ249_02370 [Lusitaniella coriacea LEGE 07157]|uniref:Uncharacterized protein n=1 Tax=Lusitaniella coriacea LEGE 07157 TaxID=945747 RepID=A0A8J7B8M0_9CYAN|nr:hypothetical protein [Lusitaniella coriacea]MBE9114733.1 hypothetical protein [Lusitaniella coriacea LEGE 07157]
MKPNMGKTYNYFVGFRSRSTPTYDNIDPRQFCHSCSVELNVSYIFRDRAFSNGSVILELQFFPRTSCNSLKNG